MENSVDPIRAEVISRHLLSISEEMGATLTRTAFSPNIKERADCSTAIFDTEGQVIALAQRVPIHLGSMIGAVDAIRSRFKPEEIRPGDMFAANDPYNGGGSHLPDINVIDFTEKRFRAAIERLPPGRYVEEDFLDGDEEGAKARIRLALTVGNGKLDFDFAGSDPQLNCARNIPYRALAATVYAVAKSLLDPDVPANAGYYRTIAISAPPGSVVGPLPPAAVGCRSISCGVLGDVIAAALSQAMPERALARSGPHQLIVLSGINPRDGRTFVNYETVAGGMGARAHRDGMDGVRVHASGASNLPIEALEHAYPLRVERYALWQDSAGAGRFRGGLGVVRDYRVLADGISVSLSSERQHVAAGGSLGGEAGAAGQFVYNPGSTDERRLSSAAAEVHLPKGSVLSVRTPAGGGFGKVENRDAGLIERDLREERISPEAARCTYKR